ncbi:MAG TPA: lipopolysaccharide biosynthesis protein [Vicinamibacterales bacterium]|nr:lipopolysaccharide biosynthesis protein [Vicinamibacterales bacterium]
MSLAQSAAAGARWSVVSVAARRLVTIVTSLVLARLLTPADFGMMAMAVVFTGFVDLVRGLGTGAAVVQSEGLDDDLLSSLFWLNLAVGLAAAAALLVAAPLAADLFREPRLVPLLRALAVTPVLAVASIVSGSLLTRELRFRRLAFAEVGGASAGGVVGIVLALKGFAVWSLVWQSVSAALAVSAATCLAAGWRPRMRFRGRAVRQVLAYSADVTGANVLSYVVRNADSLLIGRYLGAQSLGLYDLAFRVMMSSLQVVSAAFSRALFPVYVRFGDDHRRLGAAYLKVTAALAFMMLPVVLGLGGVAKPFVAAVFGPAWAGAAPLLVILAPLGALQTLGTSVNNIYQTVRRTDLLLRWYTISGLLLVTGFAIGLRWGVTGVAACYTIVSFGLAYFLFRIPLTLIGLRVSALGKTLSRPLGCSLLMLGAVLLMRRLLPAGLSPRAVLLATVPGGAIVYVAATWRFNRDGAVDLLRVAWPSRFAPQFEERPFGVPGRQDLPS